MTDQREALSRLARWRDENPWTSQIHTQKSEVQTDISALLTLVEKQQEALTAFTQARVAIDSGPANAWELGRLHEAWAKACDCLRINLESSP